jgi:hypothetical protein
MRDVHENMKREMSNESSDSYFHVRPLSGPLTPVFSIGFWFAIYRGPHLTRKRFISRKWILILGIGVITALLI